MTHGQYMLKNEQKMPAEEIQNHKVIDHYVSFQTYLHR